ncbi:MAG: hypothetical protein KC964_02230, partial [Candidatus Omnitrophica bacterium]|nr:hypothetical protein [Candidatus Omnitrophota bacterium]
RKEIAAQTDSRNTRSTDSAENPAPCGLAILKGKKREGGKEAKKEKEGNGFLEKLEEKKEEKRRKGETVTLFPVIVSIPSPIVGSSRRRKASRSMNDWPL